MNTRCAARQFSDQMQCAPCRLTWDTNDPDPPACGRLVPEAPPTAPYLDPPAPRLEFASGLPAHLVSRC